MELKEVEAHLESQSTRLLRCEDRLDTIEKQHDTDGEYQADVEIDMQDEALADLIVKITGDTVQGLQPTFEQMQNRIDELEKNCATNTEKTGELVNGYLANITEAHAKCIEHEEGLYAVVRKQQRLFSELADSVKEIQGTEENAHAVVLRFVDDITKRQNDLDAKMNQITSARTAFFAILYKKVSRKLVCDIFDINRKTLVQWVAEGKIVNATTSKGVVQRNYFLKEDVIRLFLEGNYAINTKRFK